MDPTPQLPTRETTTPDGQSDRNRRFAFAYFMKDRPPRIREIAPYHIEYWRDIQEARCVAGPFADRSGGLVTFEACSLDEATALVAQDPFTVHALLAHWWVKEWVAQPRRLPCRHGLGRCRFAEEPDQ